MACFQLANKKQSFCTISVSYQTVIQLGSELKSVQLFVWVGEGNMCVCVYLYVCGYISNKCALHIICRPTLMHCQAPTTHILYINANSYELIIATRCRRYKVLIRKEGQLLWDTLNKTEWIHQSSCGTLWWKFHINIHLCILLCKLFVYYFIKVLYPQNGVKWKHAVMNSCPFSFACTKQEQIIFFIRLNIIFNPLPTDYN